MTGEQIRWLLTAVAGVAGVGLFAWFLWKKRRKSACAVLLAASLCVGFFMLSDFRSVEEYGAGNLPSVREGDPCVELSVVGYNGEVLFAPCEVLLLEGETAMELLLRVAEAENIRVEYAADYVEGIEDLYEFDYGGESGWVYTVGGEKASVSAADYVLQDGDVVCWMYITSYTDGGIS